VLPAFFALERYCRRRADDACASHLLGLVCERLGHLAPAGAAVARAIGVLEAAYELTEDVALERPFAIANASAGRIALAQGRHARALEAFDAARGLLTDDVGEDGRLHALCGIGSGLACLRLGDVGDALVRLEAAREAVRDDAEAHTQATVVLAQALWSLGTDEAREAAKSHMLEW
jgi:superkiller protein 3